MGGLFFFLNDVVIAVVLWTLRIFFEKEKNTLVSYSMCLKTSIYSMNLQCFSKMPSALFAVVCVHLLQVNLSIFLFECILNQ